MGTRKRNGWTRYPGLQTPNRRHLKPACDSKSLPTATGPEKQEKLRPTDQFLRGRGCHDAIEKIFRIARQNKTRKWVLDADIKGVFDNIGQSPLLKGQFLSYY